MKTYHAYDVNHCLVTAGEEPTAPVAIVKAWTEVEAQAAITLSIKLGQLVNSKYKLVDVSNILTILSPMLPKEDTLYVAD